MSAFLPLYIIKHASYIYGIATYGKMHCTELCIPWHAHRVPGVNSTRNRINRSNAHACLATSIGKTSGHVQLVIGHYHIKYLAVYGSIKRKQGACGSVEC